MKRRVVVRNSQYYEERGVTNLIYRGFFDLIQYLDSENFLSNLINVYSVPTGICLRYYRVTILVSEYKCKYLRYLVYEERGIVATHQYTGKHSLNQLMTYLLNSRLLESTGTELHNRTAE